LNAQSAVSPDAPLPFHWTERWLGSSSPTTWAEEARRLLLTVGLASLYGAALGLRRGGLAIALAGVGAPVAARSFVLDLRAAIAVAPRGGRTLLAVAVPAFLVFAAVLAARVWWLALPVLTEAT
jgi:hypothetical protein